jgi:hypothetical protein
MSISEPKFSVGEVVYMENYGRGVISEVGWASGHVKIVFECDGNGDVNWWWSADRVTKLQEV